MDIATKAKLYLKHLVPNRFESDIYVESELQLIKGILTKEELDLQALVTSIDIVANVYLGDYPNPSSEQRRNPILPYMWEPNRYLGAQIFHSSGMDFSSETMKINEGMYISLRDLLLWRENITKKNVPEADLPLCLDPLFVKTYLMKSEYERLKETSYASLFKEIGDTQFRPGMHHYEDDVFSKPENKIMFPWSGGNDWLVQQLRSSEWNYTGNLIKSKTFL